MLATSNSSRRGSSPRVRGSLASASRFADCYGIIPAGAGLTRYRMTFGKSAEDHPRGCGAHDSLVRINYFEMGSSPRVRGSLLRQRRNECEEGIIPAGAGLTHRRREHHAQNGDHPRGCGAHPAFSPATMRSTGSSPRVRGSRKCRSAAQGPDGIIPAGAGLTRRTSSGMRLPRDHPRGCGAHST